VVIRLVCVLVVLLSDDFATSLLLHSTAPILLLSQHSRLLNGVRHHFLLLKSLFDVVAIELEVALLAEFEKDLRAEAAAYNICDGHNDQ